MFAQFGANVAVHSVAVTFFRNKFCILAGIVVAAILLAGCIPAPSPLVGADPADPTAPVAGVGYRSTIAPYTSLRPTAPLPWREQNDRVSPAPKSGQ